MTINRVLVVGGDGPGYGANDCFLERVGARERRVQPAVTLAAIIRCICDDYDFREKDLRGPARRRVLSNARGMIGWLARHFDTAAIQEMAT